MPFSIEKQYYSCVVIYYYKYNWLISELYKMTGQGP